MALQAAVQQQEGDVSLGVPLKPLQRVRSHRGRGVRRHPPHGHPNTLDIEGLRVNRPAPLKQPHPAQAGEGALGGRQGLAVAGARGVVVPPYPQAADPGGGQPGQGLRHELALQVARLRRVEEVPRLQEEMGASLHRELDGRGEATPQPGSTLLQPLREHPVVVAAQVVIGCGDDADSDGSPLRRVDGQRER